MPLAAKKILVSVDGSKAAEEAFRLACRLAKESEAKVYALYVIELGQEIPLDAEIGPERDKVETVLERIEALGREERCHVDAGVLQARHTGPAIVQDAVERNMDLIVLGLPHKRHSRNAGLGDSASYVLKNALCPVLIWREPSSSSSVSGA